MDIARQRLCNQHLSSPVFKKPSEVVKWLGAVQAQDYYGAKWAIGQRLRGATDELIERAFRDGKLLRTHLLRPTWHFVAADDIRWMLELTAPRVNAALAHYYRKYELDNAVFRRANKALATALRGGRQLTRDLLRNVVQQAGVSTKDLRFIFILGRAELDGIICSGARKGRQFTYALLEERAPITKVLARDEALAELTRRYFASRGPATVQDFAWWSGLTSADARDGLSMVQRYLEQEVIDGKTYWLSPASSAAKLSSRVAYLLPPYDEYLIAYKDRSAVLDSRYNRRTGRGNNVFTSPIILGGQVVGNWKRTFSQTSVTITLCPFTPLSRAEKQAVAVAAEHYGTFLGMTPVLG